MELAVSAVQLFGGPMSLAALTSADAVLAAISEFDELSRSKFLEKYSFRAAHSYFILHNNKLYA